MMNMITKNKISINNIIEFVRKAMNNNCVVQYSTMFENNIHISIKYNDKEIYFNISDDSFSIHDYRKCYLRIDYNLTERDKLNIKTLELEIDEDREDKAVGLFNDFFKNISQAPASIDDLNDNDD